MDRVVIKGHEMAFLQCGNCGVWHAFPAGIYDTCYREGGFWHCPNGHRRGWQEGAEKQEIDNLRRERDRLKQNEARLEDAVAAKTREVAAAEKKYQQAQRRAVAGVCPCCNRTFRNVQCHMATKHKNVVPLAQKGG